MKKWQFVGLAVLIGVSGLSVIHKFLIMPRSRAGQILISSRSKADEKCHNVFSFSPSDPLTPAQLEQILSRLNKSRDEVYDQANKAGAPVGGVSYSMYDNASFLFAFLEIKFKIELDAARQVFKYFAENSDELIAQIESMAHPILSRQVA